MSQIFPSRKRLKNETFRPKKISTFIFMKMRKYNQKNRRNTINKEQQQELLVENGRQVL